MLRRWSGHQPRIGEPVPRLLLSGVWAGLLATFAYDIVRVPMAHAGLPVFKAISYFGTVLLGQPTPTFASEVLGWSYHISNGVGFAVMYAALVRVPRLWTAVAWGLFLEAAMLVTPYAEVFGYKVGSQFLAITIGGHVCYGLGLYAGLRLWNARIARSEPGRSWLRRPGLASFGALLPLAGIDGIGADFHRLHTAGLPASPPAELGPHLYTTWDALEVDRVTAMWVLKRYLDPGCQLLFHLAVHDFAIRYSVRSARGGGKADRKPIGYGSPHRSSWPRVGFRAPSSRRCGAPLRNHAVGVAFHTGPAKHRPGDPGTCPSLSAGAYGMRGGDVRTARSMVRSSASA